MSRRRLYLLFIVVGALCIAQTAVPPRFRRPRARVVDFSAPPRDWSQFNYDERHSGTNSHEMSIGPENVATLQMFFQTRLPGVADGPPVLWANNSKRRINHYLFFTMMNGTLLATDGEGHLRWQTLAPVGPRWTTSSPVLDPNRQFVYSYALDGRVHKYVITNGEEVTGRGWPVLVTRKPDVEKASAALSIVTMTSGVSYLYVTFAGYPEPGDEGDYQGHVVAIRLQDARPFVFNALCSDKHVVLNYNDCASQQAGIWGRPGVVYSESDNSIYVVTSNGTFDANEGGHNWGDSSLRLHPDLRGRPIDSYTPAEYQTLADRDLDLGSSGIALIARPGESLPSLGVHAGKDAVVRLIDLRNMSGEREAGRIGGELQRIPLPQGGFNFASPAVWVDEDEHTWVYFANNRGISAFELVGDATSPNLVLRWRGSDAANSSPIVVNGVVFTLKNKRITAYDAMTGDVLWFDTRVGEIHWQSPIVINGAIYVTDLQGNLTCYALPKEFTFLR